MNRPVSVALLALGLYLGVLDGLMTLGFSAVHAWLNDRVGRAGVWIVIAVTMIGGSWAVWSEPDRR